MSAAGAGAGCAHTPVHAAPLRFASCVARAAMAQVAPRLGGGRRGAGGFSWGGHSRPAWRRRAKGPHPLRPPCFPPTCQPLLLQRVPAYERGAAARGGLPGPYHWHSRRQGPLPAPPPPWVGPAMRSDPPFHTHTHTRARTHSHTPHPHCRHHHRHHHHHPTPSALFPAQVPVEYFCALDAGGRRIDADQRPELSSGSVEYVAPAEYMVGGAGVVGWVGRGVG